jgi:hypothetical protein
MRTYTARDYLAAFEPWLLEDLSALTGALEDDTRCADDAAYRLLIPIDHAGKYPVEVWMLVHPPMRKKGVPEIRNRRDIGRKFDPKTGTWMSVC